MSRNQITETKVACLGQFLLKQTEHTSNLSIKYLPKDLIDLIYLYLKSYIKFFPIYNLLKHAYLHTPESLSLSLDAVAFFGLHNRF